MLSFIVSNYLLIVLLLGFVIIFNSSLKTIDKCKSDRIRELLIVIVCLVISGAFVNYYSSLDYYHVGNVIAHFVCYILRPAVIVLFTSIIRKKSYVKYISLLCIINTLIYIIGLSNGMTFSINEANEIIRGPMYYTSHFFCSFYFLVLLSIVIRDYNKQNRLRTLTLLSFMIECVIASFFDLTYEEVNLFDIVILICGLEYYLYIYMEHNKIDVLTKTYNRASFYNDTKKLSNKVSSVISIDMNDLKKINDTLGHDEGDKAIVSISRVLMSVDSGNVRIYRVGGDEFVALCFYKHKEDVLDYIKKAKKDLSKTKYHCSFGYAYMDNNDIFEVYKKADDEMYKDKEEYHKKNGRYR